MKRFLVFLGVALIASTAQAAEAPLPERALEPVRRIVVQHGGRHKPFDSFAREVVHTITGADRYRQADPVATVLEMMANAERWEQEPLIAIPFVPLREALGLAPKTTHVSYQELVGTRKLMRMLPAIVAKQERSDKLTMLENETMDAFQRFATLSGVLEQKLELVPPPSGTGHWLLIHEPAGYPADRQQAITDQWVALLAAVRARDAAALEVAGRAVAQSLEAANPSAYPPRWRRDLEVLYHRVQPFHVARLLYWLACLGFIAGLIKQQARLTQAGSALFAAGLVAHVTGILTRVVVGGRPPVSNFFETMLWLPFVAVVVALILERVYRSSYIALAGALLAAITLTLTDYVPLDPSITPVVAVLRSNLWLTIHVLTIVASYGAIGLATVLAHIYGTIYLTQGTGHRALKALGAYLYRVIQVGVVLLAGGIMLGAVWANASWGRYWGWDPKETWALITLLWYLAVLHGRFAGWIRGIGLALATIGGFFLLLMTYYGVSFYLVGLHSYAGGNAKPLPALLIAYVIAESAFLAVVGLSAGRSRRHA